MPDSVPEEREPIPDKRYRNRDVIEDVEPGNWLHWQGDHSRCQRRTDTVAQGREYTLQRIVIGQYRDHHDEHDAQCKHHGDEDEQVSDEFHD